MTKILAIDDIPYNLDLLREALVEDGYEVVLATGGEAGLDAVESEAPDLVLLDIKMPDIDGITVLKRLRASDTHRQLPVIMLTADTREETLTACLFAGANDYLTKPYRFSQLGARIDNALRQRARHAEISTGDSRRVTPVNRDPATGLLRRLSFLEAVNDIFWLPKNEGERVSLALLELDNVGQTADKRGADADEQLLKAFSRLLQDDLRHSDVCGRLDADTFAVCMPNTRAVQAFAIIEGLRIRLNEMKHTEGNVPLSFSSGIATLNDHRDLESLINDAAIALNRAKGRGRNRTIFKTNIGTEQLGRA